jgi:two-component system sensor histidine kinase NreB
MRVFVRSLRSRLILPVLVAAVPATVLVVLTARAWRTHEVADASSAALQVARQTAVVHTRALRHAQQTLATVAAALVADPTRAIDRERQHVLRAAAGDFALFDNLGIVEPDGRIVDAVRPVDQDTEARVRALVEASGARVRVGHPNEYVVDSHSGRIHALLAAPVPAGPLTRPRVVFATVELAWLHDATSLGALPAGTVITVLDRSARVLVRLADAAARANERDATTVRVVLTSAGGIGTAAAAEPVLRTAAVPEPQSASIRADDLDMVIRIPNAAATAAADALIQQTAVGLLFSWVFAGALAWVSSDRLSRDVNALVTTTTRLAGGDSSARADVKGSVPEVARLATSLDQLAAMSLQRERDVEARHDHTLLKLSSAIEQTADSVFITNCAGIIEYVNPAFMAMTGYPREEVLGKTPRMFASGAHDRHFYDELWATILAGRVFRAIVTNRASDGRLYNEDQTITPIRDVAGAITHFVSTGRDITDRRRTEQALRRLNGELENEAGRIASLLHDEAGQFLAFAHITLADLARDVPGPMRDRIVDVRRHLTQAEEQLRRVSHELHPRMLDDLGLAQAVRFLGETFSRRAGIPVDVAVDVETPSPRAVETVFYRLVQEALTNIGKHAKAAHVTIRLAREPGMLHCSISDDGVGFDIEAVVEREDFSLGLTLIKDRFEAVGGTLTIASAAGRGTQLRASAPLES